MLSFLCVRGKVKYVAHHGVEGPYVNASCAGAGARMREEGPEVQC